MPAPLAGLGWRLGVSVGLLRSHLAGRHGILRVAARFWMSADTIAERDRMPYRRRVDGGIEATPGNVIDHAEIREAIVQAMEFIQGLRTCTVPTKELAVWLAGRKLDHGDNPVLSVMASDLKVQRDKNLNEMPNKAQSIGRIDGAREQRLRHGGAERLGRS